MKEHPIIFNAEMVKAILEGRKTQTRRVIKPQPSVTSSGNDFFIKLGYKEKCPYGQVGDRLWVKESFRPSEDIKWKSPRFMPRQSSRITLEITDVRVERLQEISIKDMIAEGLKTKAWRNEDVKNDLSIQFQELWDKINTKKFHVLPINKHPLSWDSNPWIWCLTFKRR